MDLIDLKEIHECKVKIDGKEVPIVSLITIKDNYFVELAGGARLQVSKDTFDVLSPILKQHFIDHVMKK